MESHKTPPLVRDSPDCRNCGAEATAHYCPECGQETKEHLPTFQEFVHEFILHYFAAESRLWRTLRALLLHPGRLTADYLRGRKLRYVLPLRLYLTVSVVFFLVLKLMSAPALERLSNAFQASLTDGHSTFSLIDAGFAHAVRNPDGSFTCDLPRWVCHHIDERVIKPKGELERRFAKLPLEMFGHLSTAVFLLLPVFALYLKLAYLRRTYGEHFLFALHLHSFWFLVLLALVLPVPRWLQWVLQAYLVIYSLIALHRVYPSAWWKSISKGMAIGLAHAASLVAATVLIAIWTIAE